jgi:hypothetical protein
MKSPPETFISSLSRLTLFWSGAAGNEGQRWATKVDPVVLLVDMPDAQFLQLPSNGDLV